MGKTQALPSRNLPKTIDRDQIVMVTRVTLVPLYEQEKKATQSRSALTPDEAYGLHRLLGVPLPLGDRSGKTLLRSFALAIAGSPGACQCYRCETRKPLTIQHICAHGRPFLGTRSIVIPRINYLVLATSDLIESSVNICLQL